MAHEGEPFYCSCHHDLGVNLDLERTLDGGENRRDVAHGRVAGCRQHPVQALGGPLLFKFDLI